MHLTSPTRRPAGATRPSAYLLAAAAGAAAGLIRLIPFGYRPPNCTPLGAVGLFGGGRLPGWFAALLPPAVLAASDALLWAWYGTPRTSAWIYAAFVAYVPVGHWLARADAPRRLAAASLLGSLQFYLLTNFAVWQNAIGFANPLYPPTAAGLAECYVAGLPFLGYTAAGDLAFTALLFAVNARLADAPAPAAAGADAA